jgi:hypothetical protein
VTSRNADRDDGGSASLDSRLATDHNRSKVDELLGIGEGIFATLLLASQSQQTEHSSKNDQDECGQSADDRLDDCFHYR